MKFGTQITLLSLALGVTARLQPPSHINRSPPSLVERDLPTVTSVIAKVDSGIKALDTAVQAFSGSDSDVSSAGDALVSTIKAGTTTVDGSDDLSLADALGLQGAVTTLQGDANSLVDSLSAKKSAFEDAGLCASIRQQTTDISSASSDLIDAIVSKVPEAAQGIAKDLASGILKALAQAQSDFAEGSCTDKAGSGGGGGSTSTGGGGSTSAGSGGSGSTSAPGGGSTSAPGGGGSTSGGGSGPTTSAGGGGGATETGYPTTSAGGETGGSSTGQPAPTGGAGGNGTATQSASPTQTSPVTAGAAKVAGPVGAVVVAMAVAALL
ncbi:cell wall protein [Phialemonium atrogriseum]|uniref:Cell wall protein n=1 Tax=Phialemonium atrogriseum TaxID=1093897 RepID=A0AAJ0BXY7_9PEZI|nr:cell wall protein [Phialemonium atrogriseum]KAK1766360.1 cell wall protein [Phialemonium atrogriseum]